MTRSRAWRISWLCLGVLVTGGATEPQTPMCFSPVISTLYSVYLAYSATCSCVELQPCFVEDLHEELGDLDYVRLSTVAIRGGAFEMKLSRIHPQTSRVSQERRGCEAGWNMDTGCCQT
jgi:hypothetical protein